MQWPDRALVDHLVQRYFDFASPTYRILHQGMVERWVATLFGQGGTLRMPGPASAVSSAAKAIILLLCATASLFSARENTGNWPPSHLSETYFQMAEQLLAREMGAPTLESVQARFLTVLYLLSTSRINQVWFNFGPTVQILMAIGLHRKQTGWRAFSSVSSPEISLECSKRVLWCSFTLDQYLSLMLGRPRLLREEEIDQEYPSLVNDDNLDTQSERRRPARSCVMDAPVSHAKISRILARASQDLYSIQPVEREQELKAVASLMDQIAQWHSQLPPLLGDWICHNSLISIFQRQLTVIRLARYHAVMFVTRRLLLWDCSNEPGGPDTTDPLKHYIRSCILTARDTLEMVLELVKDNLFFPAFWYTQYIAFNALSIVYIYLIHVKRGRIPNSWLFANGENAAQVDQTSLLKLAEATQYHLGQATETNALAWRYAIVLEALRAEATAQMTSEPSVEEDPSTEMATELPPDQPPLDWENLQAALMESTYDPGIGSLLAATSPNDDFCLDFWPQLDRLPTSLMNPRNVLI